MPDVWEDSYGIYGYSGATDPKGDADGDGVTNLQEYRNHTNPTARYQRVFAAGDLSAPFDTSFAIFNPSGQGTSVEARFLFADRSPEVRTISVPAGRRAIITPRSLGIAGASAGLVLHATDGVGIVAEQTTDGQTAQRAWRQSALGVTEAGTSWTFASSGIGANGETDIVIANPSGTNGQARLRFYASYSYSEDRDKVVDVPAGRVVHVSTEGMPAGWLVVTSEAKTSAGAAPLVVERETYVDVDGVRRARDVTIAGDLHP